MPENITLQIRPRGKPIPRLREELSTSASAPTFELYTKLAQQCNLSIHRLRITKGSDGTPVQSSKDTSIHSTGLRDQSTIFVKDLGPQISWRTVFIVEYIGPLLIHPLAYAIRPYVYPSAPSQASQLQTLSCVLIFLHFLKRELETVFVHRFSASTMPVRNIFKNSFHYWILAGFNIAVWIYSPSSPTAKAANTIILFAGLVLYGVGELWNAYAHLVLSSLRRSGGTERGIPSGFGFGLVTCPNYLAETISWIGVYLVSGFSYSVLLFLVVSVGQMMPWAKKKENRYRREFGDKYKKKRYTMLPGICLGVPDGARCETFEARKDRQGHPHAALSAVDVRLRSPPPPSDALTNFLIVKKRAPRTGIYLDSIAMHFALPPRKTSHPPPYARAAAARNSSDRRRKLYQLGSYVVFGVLTIYLIFHYAFSSRYTGEDEIESIPPGTPPVVIVTVLNEERMSPDYIEKIMTNREDYASRHGYANFFTNTTTYASLYHPSPSSWSLIPALRHALTLYPHTPWFLSLSPQALITSPSLSIHSHIIAPLESLMLKDIPVVPPDSVIHTFSHLTVAKTSLILTQDSEQLSHGSLLLRNTGGSKESNDWAKFFLDTWFDPLYRHYNFQKAEGHALEHVVQWHPTILAKLVLVPQRVMNSYNMRVGDGKADKTAGDDGLWQEGDFLIRFPGCETTTKRSCDDEMMPYYEKWIKEVKRLDKGNE